MRASGGGWAGGARRRAARRLRRALGPTARRTARRLGVDLVWRTPYSPVPDVAAPDDPVWREPRPLPGIELDLDAQLAFLRGSLGPHLDGLPASYPRENRWYPGDEAAVLWAMLRHARPRRVVEVGCGHSTLATSAALAANAADGAPGELVCIDPEPRLPLPAGVRHLACGAEDVPLEELVSLAAGDVLFVDTTHVVKPGGDVVRLVLEVMPRLAPGVLVHVHDVFLPYGYPRLFAARGTYLSEQYLLQALLCESPRYEVVLALHALVRERRAELQALLPELDADREPAPSAFWLRRR